MSLQCDKSIWVLPSGATVGVREHPKAFNTSGRVSSRNIIIVAESIVCLHNGAPVIPPQSPDRLSDC